jgi:polysaccharide biosynthesis/export protein
MKHLLSLLIISLLLTSCYSNKKLVYLQDKTSGQFTNQSIEYKLQANDIISIVVKSLDPTNSELFNLQTQHNYGNITGQSLYLSGYTIDPEGCVKLPIVGRVNVSNLSVQQAEDKIQAEVDRYLKNSTVIVRMVSFKVAMLGEVRNPGYYYVFNAQANVFEGLGMAGDITNTGNHKNVKLIRQNNSGTEIHILDLTSTRILESEKFNLQPNDIIYVEPLRARTTQTNIQLWGTILSGFNLSLLILRTFGVI